MFNKKKLVSYTLLIVISTVLLASNMCSALSIGPIVPIIPILPLNSVYVFTGTVKSDTNAIVKDALVKINYKIGTTQYSQSTTTDSTGKFSKTLTFTIFTTISDWNIEVSKDGYSVKTQNTKYSTGTSGESITTVDVVLELLTYTITASISGQGSIAPTSPQTVNWGSNIIFTITPASGYKLKTFKVDGVATTLNGTSYTFTSVKANHNINVEFEPLTYTITHSVTGQGTITPASPQTVNWGSNVTLTITPASGNKVKTFTVDGTVTTLTGTTYTFTSVKANHILSVEFEAETNWLLYGGIAAVVIIAAIVLFLKSRKPAPPKPTGMRVTSDKPDLPADGRSTTNLSVELLDKDGKPMKAVEDTIVTLATSSGSIRAAEVITKKEEAGVDKVKSMLKSEELPTGTQVMIKKDQVSAKAMLMSSKDIGPVKIEASSRGLTSATLAFNFTEKKRFCMHCGTAMKVDDTVCPKCGKAPPSDVDTKECPNCKTVIPKIAKFCSECGASQPQ